MVKTLILFHNIKTFDIEVFNYYKLPIIIKIINANKHFKLLLIVKHHKHIT
jgi:hypothetical protein